MNLINITNWISNIEIDGCNNNPENSFTAKVSENIPSDVSISTILSFKSVCTECVYRGRDCMKMYSWSLCEHAMKIINLKNREMKF